MQFTFTEEQQAFADSVQRFARAQLEKDKLKRAHDPRYPFDVAKLMSAQGLMGISLPEADGGAGGTLMDAIIAIEQVRRCARAARTLCSSAISDRSARLPNTPRRSRRHAGCRTCCKAAW